MIKKTLTSCGDNSGKLEFNPNQSKTIEIKNGRFILSDGTSHPLKTEKGKFFTRVYGLEYQNKVIYYLKLFGNDNSRVGYHVGFNFLENHFFLWNQNSHWIQKKENIIFCVKVLSFIAGFIGLFKAF